MNKNHNFFIDYFRKSLTIILMVMVHFFEIIYMYIYTHTCILVYKYIPINLRKIFIRYIEHCESRRNKNNKINI